MNQANDASHAQEDGVWQDGGLLIEFPDEQRWVAIFLKFQSQGWHSDDTTGHAIAGGSPVEPSPGATDGMVRIVAALANPPADDVGRETVTILNVSPDLVNLAGWSLVDRLDNRQPLGGTLQPGGVLTVPLAGVVQLGNKGGTLSLVDATGLKVDGVSYTAAQAREGWTIVF